MAVLKRHLTHIGNKARSNPASQITLHRGKGGQSFSMPSQNASIQDYAKATPMANSDTEDMQGLGGGDQGSDVGE